MARGHICTFNTFFKENILLIKHNSSSLVYRELYLYFKIVCDYQYIVKNKIKCICTYSYIMNSIYNGLLYLMYFYFIFDVTLSLKLVCVRSKNLKIS